LWIYFLADALYLLRCTVYRGSALPFWGFIMIFVGKLLSWGAVVIVACSLFEYFLGMVFPSFECPRSAKIFGFGYSDIWVLGALLSSMAAVGGNFALFLITIHPHFLKKKQKRDLSSVAFQSLKIGLCAWGAFPLFFILFSLIGPFIFSGGGTSSFWGKGLFLLRGCIEGGG
jgi:hypothetical protein